MIKLNTFIWFLENEWLFPYEKINDSYKCIVIRYYHGSAKKDRFSLVCNRLFKSTVEECKDMNELPTPRQKRVIEAMFTIKWILP